MPSATTIPIPKFTPCAPTKEKLDYVEQVIKLLDMQEYADAVVGVPGEGWFDILKSENMLTSFRPQR